MRQVPRLALHASQALPHTSWGQSTHASMQKPPPLGHQLSVPAWSRAAALTVERLMFVSGLSLAFPVKKLLLAQMLLSGCQGQSCARLAPAAGLYLSADFDLSTGL